MEQISFGPLLKVYGEIHAAHFLGNSLPDNSGDDRDINSVDVLPNSFT
jgi:hypothetical protein